MPERIQRKRTRGWRMPEGAVYVGRPTKWGNLFKVGEFYLDRSPHDRCPYPVTRGTPFMWHATMIRKPKTESRLETEAETLFTSKGQNHDAL